MGPRTARFSQIPSTLPAILDLLSSTIPNGNKSHRAGLETFGTSGADPTPAPSREDSLALRLQIELVFDTDCPHVADVRSALAAACREAGVPAVWTEWSSEDPGCPAHARNLGSPTVLVNGEDVAPGPHSWTPRGAGEGLRTRMYRDGDSIVPIPPQRRIAVAIAAALGPSVG